MLYVYALFNREPRKTPVSGIQGEPLRVVSCRGLFAAVGEVSGPPPVEEQNVRGHELTVRRLADSSDAILPARFGCLVPDEATLSGLLESREAALRQTLALVEGREQMTLRIFTENAAASEMPPDAALGPGASYLINKMRAGEQKSLMAAIEEVRPQLAEWIRAERSDCHSWRHSAATSVASVYHLIDRGQSPRYIAALNGYVSAHPQIRLAASGPWPPYNFVQ